MWRTFKKPVAWMAMVGVLFAQMAMAAYAFDGAGSRAPGIGVSLEPPAGVASAHCAGIAPEPAPANVCEVHCTDAAACPNVPDLPPVMLTALPVQVLPLAAWEAEVGESGASVAVLSGAPPPTLRFCRLLI